ncbi:hypothetical protein M9H77_23869 [Catharanthus roseus]|uniref:Uncharacterized protein n=1 Tax=Catharanthus roseus TaxID=4058 RepID=A0ACC0AYL8_CATRO|nr:hypothetical protein M9H77_23869 [Catharanthus roseus]
MVAYMEEDLKNKFEEFKGQEKASRKGTLLSTVVLPLPSTVGFYLALLGNLIPTANGRGYKGRNHETINCELQKVNKLPQAQEVVQGSAKIHVEEETSKEDFCDLIRDKNIKKRLRLKKKIEWEKKRDTSKIQGHTYGRCRQHPVGKTILPTATEANVTVIPTSPLSSSRQ